MTSKLTRERLEKIKSWRETYGAGSNVMLPAEEAEELARIALAAMDSEPVAYTDERNLGYIDGGRRRICGASRILRLQTLRSIATRSRCQKNTTSVMPPCATSSHQPA
ncbi:hypothetical protein ACQSC6_13695 [Klebsiella pneumoniae]